MKSLNHTVPFIVLSLLMLMLPLDTFYISHIIILLSLTALIAGDKRKWITNFASGRKFYIPLIFFYALNIVGLLWTTNMSLGIKGLELKLSFLIIPLIFPLINLSNDKFHFLIRCFIISCITIIFASIINYLFVEFSQSDFIILGEKPEGNYVGTRELWLSQHFLITNKHRTFFSSYILISTVYIYFHYKRFITIQKRKYQILGFVSIFLLLFGLIVMQSKLGLVTLLFLICFNLIFNSYKIPRKVKIISVGVLILIGIFGNNLLTKRIQKMKSEFSYILSNEPDSLKTFTQKLRPGSSEIRYMVYKSSLQLVAESPILGYGTGDVAEVLQGKNYENKYLSIAHLDYGTHSQFLHAVLSWGILGLLSIMSIIWFPLYKSFQKKNGFNINVMIIILFNCIFEEFFNSRAGIIPSAIFICLFGLINSNIYNETNYSRP